MVVFTCGHCGESVQKPKVEKHYLTKCRNRQPNLSCMDCFKDFYGNDYEAHTKCVTEEERYSGKGFISKEKKGEKKQNAWVEMLQSVLDEQKNAPKNVLRIIETISKHNNTPRKKPKFFNFVKNVCGSKTSPKDIDQAWDMISVKLSALSNVNQNQNNSRNTQADDDADESKDEINSEKSVVNGKEKDSKDEEQSKNGKINENADTDQENDDVEQNEQEVDEKKLSKKQRKEEKKRKKYEAELKSADVVPTEELEEESQNTNNKKGKKKKNKSESSNGDVEETQSEGKNKNKKRKRQDTTNSVPEMPEAVEDEIIVKEKPGKAQKKKLKVDGEEEADESVCLHDQNVARIEELSMKSENFNWHAVIMSVLQKKGNELPFKRLQKKVLSEYSEATGYDVDDRIADKFIKKLRSAPNVRVDKNRVLLLD